MNCLARILLSTALLGIGGSALAADPQIHSWRDKDGNLHFGDEPPAAGTARELKVVQVTATSEYSSADLPVSNLAEPLLMYSASWCGFCKKARRYFDANGIAYREIDIERSRAGRRAYDQLGVSGVPVIVQGDRHMRGFSVAKFLDFYSSP